MLKLNDPPSPNRKRYPYQGTLDFRGLKINVENAEGSYREGTDQNGKAWRVRMPRHYGEFRGSLGVDGDPVDCFVGDDVDAPNVYVVRQHDGTGFLDEDKVMLGFPTRKEAEKCYRSAYTRSRHMDTVTMPFEDFEEWLRDRSNRGTAVPDQPTRQPQGLRKSWPPKGRGWHPIPGGRKGGMRRRNPSTGGWTYVYPERRLTVRAQPAARVQRQVSLFDWAEKQNSWEQDLGATKEKVDEAYDVIVEARTSADYSGETTKIAHDLVKEARALLKKVPEHHVDFEVLDNLEMLVEDLSLWDQQRAQMATADGLLQRAHEIAEDLEVKVTPREWEGVTFYHVDEGVLENQSARGKLSLQQVDDLAKIRDEISVVRQNLQALSKSDGPSYSKVKGALDGHDFKALSDWGPKPYDTVSSMAQFVSGVINAMNTQKHEEEEEERKRKWREEADVKVDQAIRHVDDMLAVAIPGLDHLKDLLREVNLAATRSKAVGHELSRQNELTARSMYLLEEISAWRAGDVRMTQAADNGVDVDTKYRQNKKAENRRTRARKALRKAQAEESAAFQVLTDARKKKLDAEIEDTPDSWPRIQEARSEISEAEYKLGLAAKKLIKAQAKALAVPPIFEDVEGEKKAATWRKEARAVVQDNRLPMLARIYSKTRGVGAYLGYLGNGTDLHDLKSSGHLAREQRVLTTRKIMMGGDDEGTANLLQARLDRGFDGDIDKIAFGGTKAHVDQFASTVHDSVELAPSTLVNSLIVGGVQVGVSDTIYNVPGGPNPEGQPRGWKRGAVWAEVQGWYSPSRKRAFVVRTTKADKENWGCPVAKGQAIQVMRHEMGHALDDTLFDVHDGISKSVAFRKIYDKEAKAAKRIDLAKRECRYFLQRGDAGASETVAEATSKVLRDLASEATADGHDSAMPGERQQVRKAPLRRSGYQSLHWDYNARESDLRDEWQYTETVTDNRPGKLSSDQKRVSYSAWAGRRDLTFREVFPETIKFMRELITAKGPDLQRKLREIAREGWK